MNSKYHWVFECTSLENGCCKDMSNKSLTAVIQELTLCTGEKSEKTNKCNVNTIDKLQIIFPVAQL